MKAAKVQFQSRYTFKKNTRNGPRTWQTHS